MPWICLLMRQCRFLQVIVNPESLTEQLTTLLEYGSFWFKKMLISMIPDIIADSQHHGISLALRDIMQKHEETTGFVLECISHLNIGRDHMEELRAQVSTKLTDFAKITIIPSVIK